VCLRGNIEKASIKLAQWVGIYREVSGEAAHTAERGGEEWGSADAHQPTFREAPSISFWKKVQKWAKFSLRNRIPLTLLAGYK